MPKLICTTTGNSIVSPDSDLYVHISGNRFVKKAAEDINIGDQVLFRKEFVSTNIEDVDKVLDRSLRYRHSKEILHETNSNGELIPKQRAFLMRGLAERGVISALDLEARILKEAPDFNFKEYEAMNHEVFTLVNPHYIEGQEETRERSRAAVDNWLKGDTIGIRLGDWDLYRRLDALNPEFRKFDQNDKSKEGYYWNYRLLVIAKRTIQRYLAECKGIERPSRKTGSDEERISLAPEIQLVVDYFMKDIDEKYVAARVTNVEDFVEGSGVAGKKRAELRLSAGVVTNQVSDGNVEEVDMVTIAAQYNLLNLFLKSSIRAVVQRYLSEKGIPAKECEIIGSNIAEQVYTLFGEKGRLKLESTKNWGVSLSRSFYQEQNIERMVIQLMRLMDDSLPEIEKSILNGRFDRLTGLNPGAYLNLIETTYKFRNALPECYVRQTDRFNYLDMSSILRGALGSLDFLQSALHISEDARKLSKYGFQYDKKNGIIFPKKRFFVELMQDSYFGDKLRDIFKSGGIGFSSDQAKKIDADMKKRKDLYLGFARELKEKGITIWTKEEIMQFLRSYSLEQLTTGIAIEYLGFGEEEFVKEYKLIFGYGGVSPAKIEPPGLLEQKIQQQQKERKKELRPQYKEETTVRHRKILEYIIQHPDLIEPGLELITDEYLFPTRDSIDLVFKDSERRFLTTEVEYIASNLGGLAGLLQAVKYKNMFIVDQRLEPENTVRGMLVAVRISDEIKLLCEKYGIEYKEIDIPEEAISVPKNSYQTLKGEEIGLQGLSPKERLVYDSLLKFSGNGDITGFYEQQVRQAFAPPSNNKFMRLMERLKGSQLYQIYLDLKERQDIKTTQGA